MDRWGRHRVLVVVATATLICIAVAMVVVTRNDEETVTADGPTTCTTSTAPTSTEGLTTTTADDTSTTAVPSTTSTADSTTPTTAPTVPPAVVLRTVSTTRPVVALTFDAGSDPGATSEILDLLAARGARASFGLTGCWVESYPALARQIVAAGHVAINHTQDHLSFTGYSTGTAPLPAVERIAQVTEAEGVIRSVTGADPRPWFRPPFGDYDDSVLLDVASVGYGYAVMWSVDSLGWKSLPPADVAARVIGALEPGAIVLMHVGSLSTDVEALPAILDAMASRGLRSVGLDELVG